MLTPSHLLTHPAPSVLPPLLWQCAPVKLIQPYLHCLCFMFGYMSGSLARNRQSGDKCPSNSSFTKIHNPNALIECITLTVQYITLSSLRFWDFFFFLKAVFESSCFVGKLRSCFLMPIFLVDWWFLVLCVSHCSLHIHNREHIHHAIDWQTVIKAQADMCAF